ncbi:MATE family efflux transporter [Clostridium sp. AM58-1XD]|uniref:MATE family efflux transporter n=1 Tax=Clostridium sp. AM58-1XD TaxID=2292307 RepID=UPI001FA88515|nr:MATE family efflux transporter [Clostridium sp. AM58-1XD]
MDDQKYREMTEAPVYGLILKLCGPTIVSMLITNLYNLVDTFFVSRLGTSAGGAAGVVFNLMAIIQAVGFMLGQGSGSNVSRFLGSRQTEEASRFASTGFFLALWGGGALGIVGICFLTPFMRLLGSTETILPYARTYGFYILLAAPFMASSCVLNNLLRYEGRAALAMRGLSAGAVLNMAGDPLLMYGFHMGMAGAGISTAVSQAVSFTILISMFLKGRTQCCLSVKKVSRSRKEILQILKNGMPSLTRQGLTSISGMAVNHQAAVFGDAAVAAISIVNRICGLISSIMIGIGQGMQPAAGFNYGAKKYRRVRNSFYFTVILGECALSSFAMAGFWGADMILHKFSTDIRVLDIAGGA